MNKLWYTRPASVWQEALPIGNGRVGGMVFGGVRRERIQLNEDTCWAGAPYNPENPDAQQHLGKLRELLIARQFDAAERLANRAFLGKPARLAAYQPVGDLYIEMHDVPEVIPTDYRRELDLETAKATTEYTYDSVNYRRDYIVSPDRQVLAVHLKASEAARLNVNLFANSPHGSSKVEVESDRLVMTGRCSPENGLDGAIEFESHIQVRTDGRLVPTSSQLQVRDASWATILVAIGTNHRSYNDLSGNPHLATEAAMRLCADIDFDTLARETHMSHSTLFRRLQLELGPSISDVPTDERLQRFKHGDPDPSLVALYFQFGRYLVITSSRPGTQAAGLQGIWNDSLDPGWGGGYTTNINTQMNYWAAETTGLAEMVEPLIALVKDLAETGARTARTMYGADGWVLHQATDLWRATAPAIGARWALWPTGGAWLCRHLWDRYDYSRDLDILRGIHPILVGASTFFLSTMLEDTDTGCYVTNPSCSPENIHGSNGSDTTLCAGPAMDSQILFDLFTHTITSCDTLGLDHDIRQRLLVLRSKLPPTTISADGRINEWPSLDDVTEPEPNHRHTSHLYGLYPSHQIRPETTPQLAQACAETLLRRGEAGTGWAAAWRLNLWARLQDGEQVWDSLQTLLCDMTYPNLFDVHPPLSRDFALGTFQIDGNLGGTAGILEMLIQSPGGSDDILILPALPSGLPSGSVKGARLRAGWSADFAWADGKLVSVTLHARLAGSRTVLYAETRREVTLSAGQVAEFKGVQLESEP